MQKAVPILALALSASACLLPADDTDEPVGQSAQALTSTAAKTKLDPEAAKWIDENIPKWKVYLGGKGHDLHPGKDPWNKHTNVYYDDPQESDLYAPVILVRKGDEDEPRKWVQLSLWQHQQKGNRYFDELIECGTLTMMDLVVIMSELSKHADSYMEPSPIDVLEAATPDALRDLRFRSRTTCKDRVVHKRCQGDSECRGTPAIPSWVPGPDPMNGPGPVWPAGPSRSTDANGRPLVPPDVTSTRPSLSQVPPNPAPPRTPEQNGVNPGDPKPRPSPFDKGYKPRPGEARETFKCNGDVYYGYRAACIDSSNKSVFEKLFSDGWGWVQKKYESLAALRTRIQDQFIKGHDQDECERNCQYVALAQTIIVGAIVPVACFAVTKSIACGRSEMVQLAAAATGTATTGVSAIKSSSDCVAHICKAK